MKTNHNPIIDLRYWILLCLVSVFGTNTGDLMVKMYAQYFNDSFIFGLRHSGPLPILVCTFVLVFLAEKFSKAATEFYFWSVILIIRSAATNIADTLADDLHVSFLTASICLCVLMSAVAVIWQNARVRPLHYPFSPNTNNLYWFGMLLAGVLGTIVGDEAVHRYGLLDSSLVLGAGMAILIALGYKKFLAFTGLYWFGVVCARITGTAIGDWLAKSVERGGAGLTLPIATLVTGCVFVLATYFWKSTSQFGALDKDQCVLDSAS